MCHGKPSPFLGRVRDVLRVRRYSYRTEQTYIHWIRRFILFHDKTHPDTMGEAQVGKFLTHLAVERGVSPSTQNQALNALVFLYAHVLGRPLAEIGGAVRARRRPLIPTVLSAEEVARVLGFLRGTYWLVACLQYGSGLRLMERGGLAVRSPLGAVLASPTVRTDQARPSAGG